MESVQVQGSVPAAHDELAQAGQLEPALPDAWFAWGKHLGVNQIVYSEQCITPDFCLKLQRWPLLEVTP